MLKAKIEGGTIMATEQERKTEEKSSWVDYLENCNSWISAEKEQRNFRRLLIIAIGITLVILVSVIICFFPTR